MTTCLAAFLFAFLAAVIMTNAVRFSAILLGVVDQPDNYRKIHDRPIPRLGGVGIYFAFFIPLAVLYFTIHNQVTDRLLLPRRLELAGLLAGSTVAMVMGCIDDVRSLRARWKLLFQALAGVVAWRAGFSINVISNPFGHPLVLGLFSLPVTVFWFVGCMNAVNLMDGLDGLAAGICMFVSITLFLLCLLFHNVLGMLLMACFSGAVFGFLLFNFHPAKIFLGDSGSMLLGFLVGALSLLGATRKAETAIALLTPVIALGLPIFDTLLTILRRWYKRLPLSSPDRQHVHHVLLAMGLGQRRTVLTLYFATVVLGGAALLITVERSQVTILILGSLALIAFVCVRVFAGLRVEDVFGRLSRAQERRRFAGYARVSIQKTAQELRSATTLSRFWDACTRVFNDIGLDYAELRLAGPESPRAQPLSWLSGAYASSTPASADRDIWSGQLRLVAGGHEIGQLNFSKHTTDSASLAEVPELMELMRQEMALHLQRLLAVGNTPAGKTANTIPPTPDHG